MTFRLPVALAALLAAGSALAQASAESPTLPALPALPDMPALPADALQLAQVSFEAQASLGYAADELGQERVIKGAPYCADAVHETVQWLPDPGGGAPNRIVHQQSTRLCRDGEGRTRQESDRQGRPVVYLRDPVAHESWMLDPEAKTARRLGRAGPEFDAAPWREFATQMREWARSARHGSPPAAPVPPVPPIPPVPPPAPEPAVINRIDHEVHVVRLDPSGPMAVPPAVSWRAASMAPRGQGATSPLGSKDVDGLRANGERTTWTIEAGKVGNDKPIAIVRETWTSPDLMLTLSSRDYDPRSTEVNYRLRNIRRGEPDPALMRVPAGYTQPEARRPAGKASSTG